MTQEDVIHNAVSVPVTKTPTTITTLLTLLLTRQLSSTIIHKPTIINLQIPQIRLFEGNRELFQGTLILTQIKIRNSSQMIILNTIEILESGYLQQVVRNRSCCVVIALDDL